MRPVHIKLLLRILLENAIPTLLTVLLIIFLVKGIKYFNKKDKEGTEK